MIDKAIERGACNGVFFGNGLNVRVGLANIREPAVEIIHSTLSNRVRQGKGARRESVAFIGIEREIGLAHRVKQVRMEFSNPKTTLCVHTVQSNKPRDEFKCIVLVARDGKRSGPTIGLGRCVSGLVVERIGDFKLPGRRGLVVCASVVDKRHEYVRRFVDIARGLGDVFLVLLGHLLCGRCRRLIDSRQNI